MSFSSCTVYIHHVIHVLGMVTMQNISWILKFLSKYRICQVPQCISCTHINILLPVITCLIKHHHVIHIRKMMRQIVGVEHWNFLKRKHFFYTDTHQCHTYLSYINFICYKCCHTNNYPVLYSNLNECPTNIININNGKWGKYKSNRTCNLLHFLKQVSSSL